MAEENKNENFEDTLDEDFDFLEEDEIKTESDVPAPTATKKPEGSSSYTKSILVLGGIIAVGIFIFNILAHGLKGI